MLLGKLFNVGVNGKIWRLLNSWYDGGYCQVKMDGMLSQSFLVERGVKQGSVLPPALFLLVMDLLLHQLQASGLGLSVNRLYAGFVTEVGVFPLFPGCTSQVNFLVTKPSFEHCSPSCC